MIGMSAIVVARGSTEVFVRVFMPLCGSPHVYFKTETSTGRQPRSRDAKGTRYNILRTDDRVGAPVTRVTRPCHGSHEPQQTYSRA